MEDDRKSKAYIGLKEGHLEFDNSRCAKLKKAYEDAVQAIKTNPDLVKEAEKYAESLGEFSASAPLEMKVQDYLLSQNPSYLRLYKERQALRGNRYRSERRQWL